MILWLIVGLLTAAALAAVLVPLLRRREPAPPRIAYDLTIYHDQLKELEGDLERGVITELQVRAARAEIDHRMLQAGREAEKSGEAKRAAAPSPLWVKSTVAALGIGLPAGAVAIYLSLGSPELPGQPFAQRTDTGHAVMADMADMTEMESAVEQLVQRLRGEPDNAAGWRLLGRSYLALGRYEESVAALRRAHALTAGDPGPASELGEALVMLAGGMVTPEARELFEDVRRREPRDAAARFYLGLHRAQRGESAEALEIWRPLAADAPPDAPWLAGLVALMGDAAAELGIELAEFPSQPAPAGPSVEDLAAASGMTPEEQALMIDSMVAGLAERLEDEPDDLDGWIRLARSYQALERFDEAKGAFDRARALAPGDADLVAELGELLVMAADGRVTAEASELFEEAQALSPGHPAAQFYLGLGRAQGGDAQGALEIWRALRDASLPDAPWMGELEAVMAAITGAPLPRLEPEGEGPSPEDMAAAAEMSEADRNAMIRDMVERLAQRLEGDADDIEGWLRLGRSYAVLGERAEASRAYGRAAELEPGDVAILTDYAVALIEEAGEAAGPPDRAIEVYRRILSLDPDNSEALWFVALAESEGGQRESAIGHLETLLATLRPGSEGYAVVENWIDELRSVP